MDRVIPLEAAPTSWPDVVLAAVMVAGICLFIWIIGQID